MGDEVLPRLLPCVVSILLPPQTASSHAEVDGAPASSLLLGAVLIIIVLLQRIHSRYIIKHY